MDIKDIVNQQQIPGEYHDRTHSNLSKLRAMLWTGRGRERKVETMGVKPVSMVPKSIKGKRENAGEGQKVRP